MQAAQRHIDASGTRGQRVTLGPTIGGATERFEYVGKILQEVQRQNGVAIVLADHGNCEQMIDPATGGPHTAHTTYDVELIVVDDRMKGKKLIEGGRLADVAPTALHMMGIDRPAEMTGRSLIPG